MNSDTVSQNQNHSEEPLDQHPIHPPHLRGRRLIIKSFEAKLAGHKTLSEKAADYFTNTVGSMGFFLFNLSCFLIWIVWNIGLIPGLPVFDPYPFILLTMAVSLEAIFLAVMVLISQNRAAKVDGLRAEVALQVEMIAEQEITKILSLILILLERKGINVQEDPEIQRMLKRVDPWYIEKKIEEQIGK